jgi:hypothetical protein
MGMGILTVAREGYARRAPNTVAAKGRKGSPAAAETSKHISHTVLNVAQKLTRPTGIAEEIVFAPKRSTFLSVGQEVPMLYKPKPV